MKKLIVIVGTLALASFGQGALAAADKVTICHKGVQTADVAASSVSAHQQHGDTLGACDGATMAAVVMMRCEPQDGVVTVVAASSSPSPAIENGISAGDDCAVVYAQLISSDYELTAVTTGSAEDGGALRLYTDYLFVGTVPYQ
jgi:hypothetical protein